MFVVPCDLLALIVSPTLSASLFGSDGSPFVFDRRTSVHRLFSRPAPATHIFALLGLLYIVI